MIRYVEKNWHDNYGDVHMATSHKPIWAMIAVTDFDALGLPYSEGRQLSQCFVSKKYTQTESCPSIFV